MRCYLKITSIKARPLKIRLRIPYKSAKQAGIVTHNYLDTVIVELVSDNGLKGYGEATYPPRILEAPGIVKEFLEQRIQPLLIG